MSVGGEPLSTLILPRKGGGDKSLPPLWGKIRMGVVFREDHPTFSDGLPSNRNIAAPKKLTTAKTEKGI